MIPFCDFLFGCPFPAREELDTNQEDSYEELWKKAIENEDAYDEVGFHQVLVNQRPYYWFGVQYAYVEEGWNPLPDVPRNGEISRVLEAWEELPNWVQEILGRPRLLTLVGVDIG